ncbi:MAG: hypothetical protein EA409_07210 [Saprospirales bacterium]|nr:MAG: hypothetical protein EA409_07210 [Saprospirales bacterium]
MERLEYHNDESGIKSKQRVFANIDKDFAFTFLSACSREFNQTLNCEINRCVQPWVADEKPVFRGIRKDEEAFDPSHIINQKGRILILVGEADEVVRELEEKLVCQNLILVSSDASFGSSYMDKHRKHASVKYVATQQHLLIEDIFEWGNNGRDLASLGSLRNGIQLLEPDLREREACIFNLSAIRKSDAPGKISNDVSGLSSEEACRIMRYYGFSDYSRFLWIKGFAENSETAGETANLVAQLVWYFINGAVHRPGDYPLSRENMIEFTISNKDGLPDLKFFKSRISERWWFSTGVDFDPLNLHPCSYEDYKCICEGEISDRIAATAF